MIRHKIWLRLAVAVLAMGAAAGAPARCAQGDEGRTSGAAQSTPPKLIIAIAIDQFSADVFAEYRGLFTGGLARLTQGAVFPAGYQSHGATETCPGHSTILTGSHPARTGIVANTWYNLSAARADKRVYCAEDETIAGTSSASGKYAPSVAHLLVPTLGERMKTAHPATQIVAVAGKDRAAIMMAGRAYDELLWLAPTGLTSYIGVTLSPTATRASASIARAIGEARPPLPLPDACRDRSIRVDVPGGKPVGEGRLGRDAGNFRGFLASPEADAAVLATGAALAQVRGMGKGDGTDLLILGLSASDYVGHTYGTEGSEMCVQLLNLDQELGDFFARMDATGVDYGVVLTADHGGHDLPERLVQNGIGDAERVDPALLPEALGKAVAAELGLPEPLLFGDGPFGDFYLARSLTPAQRKAALAALKRRLEGHRQVAAVFTGDELAARQPSTKSPEQWSIADRLRASYHPARSGDLIVALKPRVTPIPDGSFGYVATHGSVWDYDRRVPILFWRKGMTGFEQPNAVRTVDILPTLARWINLPVDAAGIDGQCLDLVAGSGNLCR